MISAHLFVNICVPNNSSTYPTNSLEENEVSAHEQLHTLRLKNPKKVIMGHLNINSIPNKFDGIMDLVANKLDIFLISETKIDNSFPDAQFSYQGYARPHRRDRTLGGGGLLLYVNENIPNCLLKDHNTPDDIEIICVEINLEKQKWVIIGIYRPPSMQESYFINNLSRVIDFYSKKYDRIVIMGDFNLEPSDENIENLCHGYNLYNLVKDKTCFKGPPKCYDLILTNSKHSFQNTTVNTTGFSDFHKMTTTVLKTEFVKADPILVNYRDYKNYNSTSFGHDLRSKLNNEACNKDYHKFQTILCEVLEKHAPIKKKFIRANNSPFMTKQLRKLIMNRSRCKNPFFLNKTVENWNKYRILRNKCVKLTKKVKKEYYRNLDISSDKYNKQFWKSVKPHFSDNERKNPKIILVEKNQIISDDKKTAEIMNDYFINIIKDLDIPEIATEEEHSNTNIVYDNTTDLIIHTYRNHPSILKIKEYTNSNLSFSFQKENISQIENEILELNPKKGTWSRCGTSQNSY